MSQSVPGVDDILREALLCHLHTDGYLGMPSGPQIASSYSRRKPGQASLNRRSEQAADSLGGLTTKRVKNSLSSGREPQTDQGLQA